MTGGIVIAAIGYGLTSIIGVALAIGVVRRLWARKFDGDELVASLFLLLAVLGMAALTRWMAGF